MLLLFVVAFDVSWLSLHGFSLCAKIQNVFVRNERRVDPECYLFCSEEKNHIHDIIQNENACEYRCYLL